MTDRRVKFSNVTPPFRAEMRRKGDRRLSERRTGVSAYYDMAKAETGLPDQRVEERRTSMTYEGHGSEPQDQRDGVERRMLPADGAGAYERIKEQGGVGREGGDRRASDDE